MEVFLSYCWAQRDIADEIDRELRSVGLRISRDVRSLKSFDDLACFMINAVATADNVLLVLSMEYLRSEHCMAELVMAMDREPHVVLPIRLVRHTDLISDGTWRSLDKCWDQKLAKEVNQEVTFSRSAEYPSITRIKEALPKIRAFLKTTIVPSVEELRNNGYVALLDRLGFERSRLVSELLQIEVLDDPEQREIAFDNFLRNHPDHALAHHIRALMQKARSDFQRAKESYETSISLDPKFPDAHNDYALLLENQFHEMGDAEKHYLRAIKLDERFDLALNNYGSFLKTTGRFEESATYLRRAIAVNPSYTGARMNLATLLAEHFSDIHQARYELETVLRIDDLYADAHENYAVLMEDYFGQYEIARKHRARSEFLRRSGGPKDRGWNPDKIHCE